MQDLIYGKNNIERIVSCEINDDFCELFIQQNDGSVKSVIKSNLFWLLANRKLDSDFKSLEGNLFYRYMKIYTDRSTFLKDRNKYYRANCYSIWNPKEAAMVKNGFTYFKNLKVEELTVLSFDIETTSLEHNDTAKVIIIANTIRKNNVVTRKMFCYNDYPSQKELIESWCNWVKEVDPSVLVAHNGVIYDLPYLNYIAKKYGTTLNLGRNKSDIVFEEKESKFRKDGTQFYTYKKCSIYGREIVDTFFLSLKYDIGRKYESYKLKQIIKQEELEVKNRQFYDGDLIRTNYLITEEFEKIKLYAEMDGDDALALFDLMIPATFYFTRSVPKPLQLMIESASGSQLNSILVRSYLQKGKSLPMSNEGIPFEGAISFGNPGLFNNVMKADIASLYPSIILTYNIYDSYKDPEQNFLKMVKYFTDERLKNKKLAKETGDRHYNDLEQSQKIGINSSYGLLGASGLLFNSPKNGALVTEKGREILNRSIDWAKSKNFKIPNGDTDSICFTKEDESFIENEERSQLLLELNSLYPDTIHWEADGYFKNVLIVKAKNYYLETEHGKISIKGSALKATMKEKALQVFIKEFINCLIERRDPVQLYETYVQNILNLTDITQWCSKKTVTSSVLNPERTNEQKILDAIGKDEVQEGDKIFVYFDKDKNLKLSQHWNNDHDQYKLIEKLWNTVEVFDTVIDIKLFNKYHLKTKRKLLNLNVS